MFALSGRSKPAVGPRQFPIKWVRGDFPGVRRPKREGDNSPLPSAEDRVRGAIPLLPHMRLNGLVFVKHLDSFTLIGRKWLIQVKKFNRTTVPI